MRVIRKTSEVSKDFGSWLSDSFQLRVLRRVRLAVEAGGDEQFRRQFLALGVLDDGLDDFDAHLVGELDRIGIELTFLDRLLSFRLAVEADDLDLPGLACFLQGRTGAKSRRVIDGENA